MPKSNMELSEKEYSEVIEKLELETTLLEETEIVDSVYKHLLSKRIILINDVISANTIEKVVMPLLSMDNDGTNEKITIYINTNGGSVYDGLVVCNIIERLKTKTDIIVLGYAYSMGSLILMAGKNNPNVTRYCYPFSTSLIHGGSSFVSGTSSQVKDYFKFNERYEKRISEFIVSHTNLTQDDYMAIERYEAYMDSDEMLEKGLVDVIL
jgi:ATP-dependent Clp protease protease subunit